MTSRLLILALTVHLLTGTACDSESPVPASVMEDNSDSTNDQMNTAISVKIGSKTFSGTLADNASAKAFKAMLPLTINMSELNGNEKLFRFSQRLPSSDSNPGTIQTGDLMLWSSNTLVVFYKSFSTPYSYTRIGKIDNPDGLAEALGSGGITVTIELK